MKLQKEKLSADFVVAGGGIAGICAAVAAARNGLKVILIQDRPVLGGNASSEIRMWICGAHGSDNREAGLLEELKLANYYANPTLKYALWDHVLYDFVIREKNIRLLLNTTVFDLRMEKNRIRSVIAWNLTSYTEYEIEGAFFSDCSGDSILRLSGALYRTGRESSNEFGESHAPVESDRKTMGSSVLIQLRRTKKHQLFHAPSWAYHFTGETFLRGNYAKESYQTNNFWWLEFGGVKDTVKDADEIRHELLRIAYGSWEYLKNNNLYHADEWELDWIGALPGKRESCRYVGDYIMIQPEIEAGGQYPDVIAHGGWTMDDHNPEAFFTSEPATIFHPAPAQFGIPYRSLYSKNVENLFFAGRNISVSHMALSATRVMGTCAVLGQAAGTAAAIAVKFNLTPRGVYEQQLELLQQTLAEQDQLIPGVPRKVSLLALKSRVSHEELRCGIDRSVGGNDNGVWLKPGCSCEYLFQRKAEISGCRIIFDSDFSDTKRMRNYIACDEDERMMPAMLAKEFRVSALVNGQWQVVFAEKCNIRRYVPVTFSTICVEGLRLTVDTAWGGGNAHVFAFEPRQRTEFLS